MPLSDITRFAFYMDLDSHSHKIVWTNVIWISWTQSSGCSQVPLSLLAFFLDSNMTLKFLRPINIISCLYACSFNKLILFKKEFVLVNHFAYFSYCFLTHWHWDYFTICVLYLSISFESSHYILQCFKNQVWVQSLLYICTQQRIFNIIKYKMAS